jgi:hypothetical protein
LFSYYFKLQLFSLQKAVLGQALVAHACNPSNSGGRDQEDMV